MKPQFTTISIDKIVPSKTNPRTAFPPGELAEIQQSIEKTGMHMRPIVRLVAGKYELVDGERRYRAMKELKRKEMECEVREMTDDEVRDLQMASFLQKTGLSAVEEANAYHDWSKAGVSPEEMAARTGKAISHIVRMLSLLKLIDTAKKSFDTGILPLAHALEICRLQPKEQAKALEYALRSYNDHGSACGLSELKNFIQQEIQLDLREAAFSKSDANLCPAAGACTVCPKRTGYNKTLFNDITTADTCMDPKCFAEKQTAHLANVKVELKAKKQKFVEVTKEGIKPQGHPDAITWRSFKEIKGKGCKYATTGILIDGSKKGTLLTICRSKECSKHWGKERMYSSVQKAVEKSKKSPEQLEKERIAKVKEQVKEKTAEYLKETLLTEVGAVLPTELDKESLVRLADTMVDRSGDAHQVGEMVGIKLEYWDNKKRLSKLSEEDLIKVIHASFIAEDEDNGDSTLIEKAKEWGMDLKGFEADAKSKAEKEFAEQLKPREVIADAEETKRAEEHSKKAGTIGGVGRKSLALPEKEVPAGREDLAAAEKRTKAKKGGKKK